MSAVVGTWAGTAFQRNGGIMKLKAILVAVVVSLSVSGGGVAGAATTADATTGSVPVPADGTAYFGVHLGEEAPSTYVQRSGLRPADYGQFAALPLTDASKQSLSSAVDAIRAQNGKLFLTVEPFSGLDGVTTAVAQDLAATLADYNARGVDVFLRFAHEMNGSWYAWGQQPAGYLAAFRRVADAVHGAAPRTAMVWAPNYGGGYPFSGGAYSAVPGSAAFSALDTNGSGTLTMADDPYAPYYPGDAYVDWVGLTLYHFGHAWPYGENETPEPGKFAQQLRGTYTGNGRYEDQSAVPDFYSQYAVDRAKPMAVTETGALYNETPKQPGSTEYDIKASWLGQVYADSTRTAFPLLKMVNWFEIRKYEGEAGGIVDWRATANPAVRDLLRTSVGSGRYVFADTGVPAPAPTVAPGVPTGLTGYASNSPTRVVLSWSPPTTTGGAALTSYVACRTDNNACQTLPAGTPTATFSSLQRKTSYTFTVRATNSAGTGAAARVTVRTK
jgi:hypothetical protein